MVSMNIEGQIISPFDSESPKSSEVIYYFVDFILFNEFEEI
jgi:hypothetical protein